MSLAVGRNADLARRGELGDNMQDERSERETDGGRRGPPRRTAVGASLPRRDLRDAQMTDRDAAGALRDYRRELERTRATGQATEHSYRPALRTLAQELGGAGVHALNEPSRVACGAPDFIVERRGVPVGHIECKDVGADLNQDERDEQLKRYRTALPNLILTDYLEFRWYADGELRETARLGRFDRRGKIVANREGLGQVTGLFQAFLAADTPSIGQSRELAERMAAKTRLLRDGVERILEWEGQSGPLSDLLAAYRDVLFLQLPADEFADLQAQTAAYGLFAARCLHDPKSGPFTRRSAVFAETTPFLREVFGHIAGPGVDSRLAWIVDDLARLLDRADMAEILADFGRRTRREDPVVHFYEDFLAAYDPKRRAARGVYYTPEPVVSYIVASVDRLLRERFGLADGLADTATIDERDPEGQPTASPRVLILDPAAGTGTFLREAVATVRETIEGKGLGGAWPDYVRDHLLPRLFGFELLMAPYAICHLKLALEIGGTDAGFRMPDGQRLGVFLTNALEEAHEGTAGALFAHEVAREAADADAVKREKPVMVVIGNPPYRGESANEGAWIKALLQGRDGAARTGSYFEVDGEPLCEKNLKWLYDDYVKFIRFAQWRIESTGEGVLGFVTNHGYLDNPTFRGMRKSLMEAFDEIYLLDLHGDAMKRERAPDGGRNENVFDIQKGVAIGLFVKRADSDDGSARVFHADLWGEREAGPDGGKYGWLSANDVGTTSWTELAPMPPLYLFAPRDEALREEYETYPALTDVFPVNSIGIVTARDRLAIQWTADDMRRVVEDFASRDPEDARAFYRLGRDVRDWKVEDAQRDVRGIPGGQWSPVPILYRPFDTRFTCYTGRSRGFICMPRPNVMRHMLRGPNVGIVTTRQGRGQWNAFAAKTVTGNKSLDAYDSNSLFPLYTYATDCFGKMRAANLDPGFVESMRAALGLDFIPDGAGDLESVFGPEDVFHYIYAVLHSPEYRRRYADFLKSDFPRAPLTDDRALFAELVGLGRRLAALHLMEAEGEDAPAFPDAGDNRIDKVRYAPPSGGVPGRVWINGGQYFEGVSPDVWAFAIGGYRPAEKWLKDRKGRFLSFEDIARYRRICAALAETPCAMARIDQAIDARGGWPLRAAG